jgi:hypothetical protein
MNISVCGAALAACLTCGAAAAQVNLGSRFICATVEAMDCDPGVACFKGRPADLGAPAFMRIDFDAKTIGGAKRTTPILFMEKSSDGAQVLLQGTEIGFGWTMAIDMKAGTMAATLVNREGAFVLFGSCTPL